MSKIIEEMTIEEMADEYSDWWSEDFERKIAYDAYLAGYTTGRLQCAGEVSRLQMLLNAAEAKVLRMEVEKETK